MQDVRALGPGEHPVPGQRPGGPPDRAGAVLDGEAGEQRGRHLALGAHDVPPPGADGDGVALLGATHDPVGQVDRRQRGQGEQEVGRLRRRDGDEVVGVEAGAQRQPDLRVGARRELRLAGSGGPHQPQGRRRPVPSRQLVGEAGGARLGDGARRAGAVEDDAAGTGSRPGARR